MNPLSLSTYDYQLPEKLIAQVPHDPADECRLLVYAESSSSSGTKAKDPENLKDPSILDSSLHSEGQVTDTVFSTLPSLLDPERHILFFNESKVLRARVPLQEARSTTKAGNEKIFDGEIFFLRAVDEQSFVAMVYPGDRFPVGGMIQYGDVKISVESLVYEGRTLRIQSGGSTREFLERFGQMPLPPYVEYTREKESVYQPVFAQKEGSVASPTASLHFTTRLLDELTQSGFHQEKVVLHVGLGTFKNIYEENIQDFEMHAEYIEVKKELFESIAHYKSGGKTILAIGTTVTRTLESLPFLWPQIREKFDWSKECMLFWDNLNVEELSSGAKAKDPGNSNDSFILDSSANASEGLDLGSSKNKNGSSIIQSFSISGNTISFESKIFIYPGFRFCIVDEIITNFHLPKSTLLMLVSAFAGIDKIKKIYEHAVREQYRFFSFGDAMYLKKNR